MQNALHLTESPAEQYVYLVQETAFTSFADAVKNLRRELYDDETGNILRLKLNDPAAPPINYTIDTAGEIVSVSFYEDADWNIEFAFAELPHTFHIGDIIEYKDEFYVVANNCYADENTRWLKNADYTDMSLYCFAYCPNKLHSCGGTYGHAHIPILQAERVEPEALSNDMKPLLALSLLLKDKMKITDYLEYYSNGALLDLMQYYERRTE